MANVSFGTFSKRRNSTKQPSGLSDSRDVKLKDLTSIDRPTFILSGNDFHFNYAEFDSRYYFVDDIRSVHNGLTEVDCKVDTLATYKSYILNTIAYVLYDSVANTELVDNRLPLKTSKTVSAATVAFPWNYLSGGCYILSLTGAHDTTGVYKVTESELAELIDDVSDIRDNFFPSSTPPDPDDYADSIIGMMQYWGANFAYFNERIKTATSNFFGSGNIPENIRECRYLPFDVGITGSRQKIYLGTFETKTSLGKLTNDTVVKSVSVSIPWQAADFRRRSPYTDVYIYLPYIGLTKLSSENLAGQSSLTVSYAIGIKDGSMIATVSSGSEILGQYSCNIAASVPVGFSNINIPRAAQSVISGVANTTAKNYGGVGMSVLNFADAVTPNYSCIGGLDGVAGIATNQNITCYTVLHDTIVAPNQNLQVIGAPSMCSKQLGSLTGFCQCLDAHVDAPAMASELEEIDNFLNSGFFIE